MTSEQNLVAALRALAEACTSADGTGARQPPRAVLAEAWHVLDKAQLLDDLRRALAREETDVRMDGPSQCDQPNDPSSELLAARDAGDYYDRITRETRAAWHKVSEAIARGSGVAEIARLREAAIDAGDTGD